MDTCHICGQPVLPGQPRYTAGEGADPPRFAHWECHERDLSEFQDKMRRVPELYEKAQGLIRRLRRPDGLR